MIYALIKNGRVVNTIVVEPEIIHSLKLDADLVVPLAESFGIGHFYDPDKREFSRPLPPITPVE